jgi:hypothetical protein
MARPPSFRRRGIIMDIAELDIGGARVRRRFTRGEEAMMPGRFLSADEVRAIPVANRRALSDAGYIEIFPQAPVTTAGDKHIVHLGRGQYDVIHGVKLNAEPLTKEQAEDLATRPD